MKTLYEFASSPSAFDSYSNYLGETPPKDLLVVLTQNRDSDILSKSNWQSALKILGGESENVVIYRFKHWACGWWEALCVKSGTKSEKLAHKIVDDIKDYPILDEEHFSTMEMQCANETWANCYSVKERIEYLRNNNGAEFRSFSDLLQCIRGQYAPFTNSGYDSLIN